MPLAGLLDVLYPPTCAACGRVLPGEALFCEECASEVERTSEPQCARCGEPGHHATAACRRCTTNPPEFLSAFAPFVHGGAVARAIHRFKYEDHPELARPLGALLAQGAATQLEAAMTPVDPTPVQLCAVPLHVRRFRERRFDQAQLLCAELAKLVRGAQLPNALTRVRETNRQVGRTHREREQNVAGAFEASDEVQGKRLVLVDDVFTTGATAQAAAVALRAKGATVVLVLTLARANLESP